MRKKAETKKKDNFQTPTKNTVGRPEFEPTQAERETVEKLSGYGIPQEQIAMMIRDGIAKTTLITHFRRELDLGMAKANSRVASTLFDHVVNGNVPAAIFWAKARMGWTEKSAVEVTNPDGSMTPKLDLSKLSSEAIKELMNAVGTSSTGD